LNRVFQDPGYSRLKDHLIASTGLAYYAKRDEPLTELIGERLSNLGLRDCSSYAALLADGARGNAEMDVLISQLTVGETYFFRDEQQYAAIREIVLPDILERKRFSKQLRIWSAGCATGAEPYSLAILLARALAGGTATWDIDIQATDLDRGSLARAAEGKFRASALRATSDDVKRYCFSHEGRVWTIHPQYKKWISFHQMNLAGSEFLTPWIAGTVFDLILCRNVMIYFAPEANRRLIGRFHQSLADKGWLVVGGSEHNHENFKSFRTVNAAEAKLYQKMAFQRGPMEVTRELAPEPAVAPSPPARPRPDFAEGLRQLADRGDWKGAAEHAERLLAQDRLNPAIHYYQALIFDNLGTLDESERSLRQAIYLDRNFALAHYHLGLALKRDGQTRAAARSFGNVLKVLAGMPDQAIVRAGPGVTVTGLRDLAKMHLEHSSGS
jgi:chemotaxis protein methyltransferase CheR